MWPSLIPPPRIGAGLHKRRGHRRRAASYRGIRKAQSERVALRRVRGALSHHTSCPFVNPVVCTMAREMSPERRARLEAVLRAEEEKTKLKNKACATTDLCTAPATFCGAPAQHTHRAASGFISPMCDCCGVASRQRVVGAGQRRHLTLDKRPLFLSPLLGGR